MPEFHTAMENWGLSLYSRDTLLFDQVHQTKLLCLDLTTQEKNDLEERWKVLNVVAHELAHQWTGNLVTMKWSDS